VASEVLPDARGGGRRGRRPATAARRRERAEAIITATRALFDERGVRDAQIDDIARAVGVNRAIIYRHFTGKEELFGLTLVRYLDELADDLREADDASADPATRLCGLTAAFHDFGMAYPAFVDCAQTLMRNTGTELFEEFSEGAVYRLGRAIAQCLGHLVEVLEAGIEAGQFHHAARPGRAAGEGGRAGHSHRCPAARRPGAGLPRRRQRRHGRGHRRPADQQTVRSR
jgi:AcrR family transcriptional regulator